MKREEFIKELEEILLYFQKDGMYAIKGLEDKIDNLKKQQIFKAKQNPLSENCICIYERLASKWVLRFQIDKSYFENDIEFLEFIEYTLESLNKNCN